MENLIARKIAFLSLICFALTAYAGSDPAWLLQNLKNSEVITQYAQGKINGKIYTAIVASKGNQTEENHTVFVIFESQADRHKLLADVDIGDSAIRVKIKNDSIYIRQDYAHHGIRFIQYQFKQIGTEFKMVGIEDQDMSLSDYIVSEKERNASNYRSQEMWSGTSTNFLTSRGECWLNTLELSDSPTNLTERKEAQELFERGARPKNGVIGEIRFSPTKLFPLSKWDGTPVEFFYPSCYFDYKKHLHKITAPS